jgi:hypothetical protein
LQPAVNKQPYIYDSFAIGNLYQVSRETYAIFAHSKQSKEIEKYQACLSGESKKWDDVNIVGDSDAAFVVLKKGQLIPNTGISKKFNPIYVDGEFRLGNSNCIFFL